MTEQDLEFYNYTDPMERLTAFEETIRDLEREEFKLKRQKRRR
jgi:hypothetical protein